MSNKIFLPLFKQYRTEQILGFISIGLILVLQGISGVSFGTQVLTNFASNSSYFCLAIGMLAVMATGGIDLSASSILALSAVCAAQLLKVGLPPGLAVFISFVVAVLLGVSNGILIVTTHLQPLIITLATSFIFRGIVLVITGGLPISQLPKNFRSFFNTSLLGLDKASWSVLIMWLVMAIILHYTVLGHYLTGIGGNASALKRAGVSVAAYTVVAYVVAAIFYWSAGLIIISRLNSAEPTIALNHEMYAICAVVMGGSKLTGGNYRLTGTILAVFLLGAIRQALVLANISPYFQQLATGLLLLIFVVISSRDL